VSVYGIRPNVLPGTQQPVRPTQQPKIDRQQAPDTAPARGYTAVRQPAVTEAPNATSNALPASAPPGTDPELWAVLTNDERAYFAKIGAMGPLTYGRVLQQQPPSAPMARGGRIDVKA
jgi:hypothetical protein